MWEAAQARFAAALIDQSCPLPMGIGSCTGAAVSECFDIHRNNFAGGLAKALAVRFPVTERVVGEEFFAAMAGEFALRHPPDSPVLLDYGGDFADFVERFEPARTLAYLLDIVRLENARVRAYHAADAAALAPDELARVPKERLADVTFDIHPSTAILRSKHPIVTIWAMNMGETRLAPISDWTGEDALVTRPRLHVDVRRLPPGGATFLERLIAGATLGDAAQAAAEATASFDLAVNLAGIVDAGALAAIRNEIMGDER